MAFNEWWEAVRAEPELFWQTVAVRYTAYILGGLVLLMIVRSAIGMLEPAGAAKVTPKATTANFDVICSNPACGRHFVVERKFKFRGFPVACPYCDQKTGHRALRCSSDTCHGKLTMTIDRDGTPCCAECGSPVSGRR